MKSETCDCHFHLDQEVFVRIENVPDINFDSSAVNLAPCACSPNLIPAYLCTKFGPHGPKPLQNKLLFHLEIQKQMSQLKMGTGNCAKTSLLNIRT